MNQSTFDDPLSTKTRRNGRMGHRTLAAILALCLIAGACGGSDEAADSPDENTSSDESTDATLSPTSDADAGVDNSNNTDTSAITASIPWTAPADMNPTILAVSPDGSQVAAGFVGAPGIDATPAEIIVYDIATGSESWSAELADVGMLGLGGIMFTDAGVSFYLSDFEGSQVVTVSDGGTVGNGVPVESNCSQFLDGAVDSSENVAYTVVPSGICRVDLLTGSNVEVGVSTFDENARIVESIRHDSAGNLVATYTDSDFNVVSKNVDPATLASLGPAAGEPPSPSEVHRDLLIEGVNASSGDRIAASPDGSTVALLQPGSIDILG